MHMITGVGTGNAALLQGGTNGLGRDALENAAQVDTGETRHVALLLTPDYGEQRLRLYIGQKGFKSDGTSCGNCTGDALLLARNGLAFGSWFYLQGSLPGSGTTYNGTFGTVRANGLYGLKLEDVSTNPNNPRQGCNNLCEFIYFSPRAPSLHVLPVILANENSGVYILDFGLNFSGASGYFSAAGSSFAIRKLDLTVSVPFDPDNVEWTKDGSIFVQMDNSDGGIIRWKDNAVTNVARTKEDGER